MTKKMELLLMIILINFVLTNSSFAMIQQGGFTEHHNIQSSAQKPRAPEHMLLTSADAESSKAAVNVGNKICPVSGITIGSSGMEPVTYEYKSKIYNFCCAGCIDEFKKDPEKYIKKVDEELQSQKNEVR